MKLYSGQHLDHTKPEELDIDINDIAVGLSREARYNGHTPKFYSVAQHSLLVSSWCSEPFMLEGLLHDAAEAYCKDLPSPLKKLIPGYSVVEKGIDLQIRKEFHLPPEMSDEVRLHDERALRFEMTYMREGWFQFWLPERAEWEFRVRLQLLLRKTGR